MLLQHLESLAINAHRGTSFSPEKRGQDYIKSYSEDLQKDIDELTAAGIGEDVISEYKARYSRLFASYLSAKSRCISTMITGPSNFPVRRAEKANRSEQKHHEVFCEWQTRAKRAILRKNVPVKTFVSEIDRYKAELESLKTNHENMKQGNKRISAAVKSGEDLTEYLTTTFGIAPHMIDWYMKWGFGLQNSNANIKRVEQRIKEMEMKEKNRQEKPETSYTFEGGEIVINYEIDRIQIKHNEKPSEKVRKTMKTSGFNWSPSENAWQRKITQNAWWTTKRLFKDIKKAA